MAINSAPYLASFRLLLADFVNLLAYIEPADDNLRVYSHRLYELLLRSCTEFESLCKSALREQGDTVTRSANINTFTSLESSLRLETVEVGVHVWRPQSVYVRPFAQWSTAQPPLSWYSGYNKVKHDRSLQFQHANLENVRLSLAGVFALLGALSLLPTDVPGHMERYTGAHVDVVYAGFPELSFRRPMQSGADR